MAAKLHISSHGTLIIRSSGFIYGRYPPVGWDIDRGNQKKNRRFGKIDDTFKNYLLRRQHDLDH